MMKLITYIQKRAKGKTVLLFFIPAMAVYLCMLFYSIPKVEQYSNGMKIFDLLPAGYSYEYAIQLLETLGDEGRNAYLYLQLPLDFIYPGLFAVSCSLIIFWLFAKFLNQKSRIYYFGFVPLFAGFFDYIENIFIAYILISYPEISEINIILTSMVTILKSAFTSIFFISFIAGCFYLFKTK